MRFSDFKVSHAGKTPEELLHVVAIESTMMTNVISTIQDVLPEFASNLKGLVRKLTGSFSETRVMTSEIKNKEKKVFTALGQVGFMTVADKLVSIPENFQGNFQDYAKALIAISSEVYRVQNTVIAEYTTILSAFISNKEDKIALKDHTAFFKRTQGERERLSKQLAHFFPGNTGISKAKLKTVIARTNDIPPLLEEVRKLTEGQAKASLEGIQIGVNKCVSLLDMIIQDAEKGGMMKISPNAAMNISTGAFEVGKYVEFVSVVYHDVMVFTHIVDGMLNAIAEQIEVKL